jgi:hypothetical protein
MAWSITDLFPSWGDSGEQPPDGFQYDGGDQVNEKHLDYLWSSVGSLEDEVRAALDDLDDDGDGVVDEADYANDADASTFKGNDLDANGDGVVDEADDTTTVKGNDIDSDGDGRVDAADDATTVKGNDIDSDGNGVVDEADYANDADASTYKGSDIDANGDGVVDEADYAQNADKLDGNEASTFVQSANVGVARDTITFSDGGQIDNLNSPVTDTSGTIKDIIMPIYIDGQVTIDSNNLGSGSDTATTELTVRWGDQQYRTFSANTSGASTSAETNNFTESGNSLVDPPTDAQNGDLYVDLEVTESGLSNTQEWDYSANIEVRVLKVSL